MRNKLILCLSAFIFLLAGCTKKETILQQYTPPSATLYGTWLMVNTSSIDSSKNYLVFPNDGSNYYYQLTSDKYGFRKSQTGVFNATDKQVIISSGGVFNYTVRNDSLILNQTAVNKIIALRVVSPAFTPNNFVTTVSVLNSGKTMAGLSNFNYGFGFNGDTMFINATPYGSIRGYKYCISSKVVADSWNLGLSGSMHYNAGYVYHAYSGNFQVAKRVNASGGAFTFFSSNKLIDVRNLSMNSSTNFIYAFQVDYKLFTGVNNGTCTQIFDFTPYSVFNVIYHSNDAFLGIKNGYIYKFKIAPKFQVLESYQLPVNYSLNNIATNGTDVWVYANNNITNSWEFVKVNIP